MSAESKNEDKHQCANLYHAIIRDHVDCVDSAINLCMSMIFNMQDAIKTMTFRMANKLIEKGFNFTYYVSGYPNQITPLIYVENEKIIDLIIEKGNVDFSYKLYRNSTVFECILECFSLEAIKKIIKKHPKLLNSKEYKSDLLISTCDEDFEKFKYLIEECDCDPYYENNFNQSAYDYIIDEAGEFYDEELQKCLKYLQSRKSKETNDT